MTDIIPLDNSPGALDRAMAKRGMERVDPATLSPILRGAIFHTQRTHTAIMVGNNQVGHTLRIICDSTGQIVEMKCDARGEPKAPYPACRACGLVFGAKAVIETKGEVYVDTDRIDAWPALPWWPGD